MADVKGNDEENGKDIADLEDHKLIVASEDEVFQVVEQAPEYPGGMAALMKWIGKEIKYPSIAQEMNIEGRVIVQFVIGRDGSVRDVQVLRTVDPTLDKEAVRVVKAMRKWFPEDSGVNRFPCGSLYRSRLNYNNKRNDSVI